MNKWLEGGNGAAYFRDISVAKNSVFVCLGTSLVITFIYLYMMANCSTCLAYISVIFVELFHLAAIGGCLYYSTRTSDKLHFYIAAGVFALFFLIFNCMLCCYRRQFAIALAVIDSAADFLVATKRIAFVPLCYFVFTLVYLVLWGLAVPGVIAINEITANVNQNGH